MQRMKKGDTVEVIAGKDIGEKGEVIRIISKKNRVVVSGINTLKRHHKARQIGNQQIPAQIAEFDAPLHISNVMLICPECEKKTRVGFVIHSDGSKERVCKKCNAEFE
jgi:large subunit ribosomal protein L24